MAKLEKWMLVGLKWENKMKWKKKKRKRKEDATAFGISGQGWP